MDIILKTENLSKRVRRTEIVKDICLTVRRNTVYGLLGPNGAGKSSTLKMIAGIWHPTGGKILYDGHEWSRNDLNGISALIETPPLYENLSARENLKVKALLLGIEDARIDAVLAQTGLENTGKKKAKEFSLGMKQRLGIALALLNEPKLLILDEPTNGLDPLGIQELRGMIRSFTEQGITVILSSHILSEVRQVADDIGIIAGGRLEYQAPLSQTQDLETLFLEIVGKHREVG